MKKILVLLDNPYTNDRRVSRESEALASNGFNVTLIATHSINLPDEETINGVHVCRILSQDIFDIKRARCFKQYAELISKKFEFNIIHANDQTMLNLGCQIKKIKPQVKIIYDSHELFHAWPLNLSSYGSLSIAIKSIIVRKIQIAREKHNKKYIDQIITVNNSLAKDLQNYLKARRDVCVVRNIPESSEYKKSNILRNKFNIPNDTKILVFIGANIYAKTLNLEQVIDEFANQDKIALVFICANNLNSKPIVEYAKCKNATNIFFHDIISPSEISEYLSSANVGLVPTWNKKDLSYWFALDNKLFEYINAHIPVLATQQPEYINIVDSYKCGVCVNPDNNNAYIDGFNDIINDYGLFVGNTEKASAELTWEKESNKLIELYKSI